MGAGGTGIGVEVRRKEGRGELEGKKVRSGD